MESKNLNDIVIEDSDSSKKAQLKNILTLLALLFIILVISIVITKLILGNDNEVVENGLMSSDATTEVTGANASSASTESSSVATTATAAVAAAGAAALATRAISNSASKDDTASKNSDTKSSDTKSSDTKPAEVVKPKPVVTEEKAHVRKKLTLRDHRSEDKAKSKSSTSSRSTRSKESKTYVPRARNTTRSSTRSTATAKRTPAPSATRGYYIKVGAFKDPSSAIRKIKATHLRYRKIGTKDGKATRVLVGPYYSRKDAQNDMAKVKSKIASDAYITKIK